MYVLADFPAWMLPLSEWKQERLLMFQLTKIWLPSYSWQCLNVVCYFSQEDMNGMLVH